MSLFIKLLQYNIKIHLELDFLSLSEYIHACPFQVNIKIVQWLGVLLSPHCLGFNSLCVHVVFLRLHAACTGEEKKKNGVLPIPIQLT